jgi:hypothetical protein
MHRGGAAGCPYELKIVGLSMDWQVLMGRLIARLRTTV